MPRGRASKEAPCPQPSSKTAASLPRWTSTTRTSSSMAGPSSRSGSRSWRRRTRSSIPGGIDPHTHMELPFGGTSASDTFETGTIAAAHGGTTTIIDFAVQYKGQSLKQAVDAWHAKADGKTSIDYGFHLICTDLPDERLPEMRSMIDEWVSSFKLFMAYPGVFLVDDATIFKAMGMAGENGGLICMHAENGVVIDAIVKKALQEGKTAPKYHALTRPTKAEAEGVHRAIALAEIAGSSVYIVHLSCA